jgi:hypothetical protein
MIDTVGTLIKAWFEHLGSGGGVLAMVLEYCLVPLPSERVIPLTGAFTTETMDALLHGSVPGVALAGAAGSRVAPASPTC